VSEESVENRVKDIVAEQLGLSPDEVRPDSQFTGDLGADELDLLEIIMAFEEEFQVDIDEETMQSLVSVQDAVDFLSQRLD
jgi:acyl carrier protein